MLEAQTPKQRGKFIPPGYGTRLEAFMEVVRFGPAFLPGAEFLALLFHVERSLPYGKASDAASLSQMTGGIRKNDGVVLRAGCGLGCSAAKTANASLERRGLLKRKTHKSNRFGNKATEYAVRWEALKAFFANNSAGLDTPLGHQTAKLGHQTAKLGHDVATQSNHHQSKKKQSNPSALVKASGVVEIPKPTPKPISRKADDEKTKPQPPAGLTPEQEFTWRVSERHPMTVDAERVLADVQEELQDVPFAQFLEADARATTAPERLTNPHGHYRKLARMLAREKAAAPIRAIRDAHEVLAGAIRAMEEQAAAPRCPTCHGIGTTSDGQYCPDCQMGRDLEATERRAEAAKAKKKAMAQADAAIPPDACFSPESLQAMPVAAGAVQ